MYCKHQKLFVDSKVLELAASITGPVTGHAIEIKIHCTECGQPFRFHRAAEYFELDTIIRIKIEPTLTQVKPADKSVVN